MAWKKLLYADDTVPTHAHLQADVTDFDHGLVSADHTASGLTAGHVMTALTATTFDFAAPAGPTFEDSARWWVD
jgi:hypothetical protein